MALFVMRQGVMEARVMLTCGECGLTREIAGEIPDEYIHAFETAVHEDGWAPRPGSPNVLICRACLGKYEGHESVDDEEKVKGRKNPMEP